jgi:hypothetical protein
MGFRSDYAQDLNLSVRTPIEKQEVERMNRHPNTSGLRPPWRRGQASPNPSGRPRRLPISDVYAKLAAEPVPPSIRGILKRDGVTLPPDATLADALATRMFLRAIAGDCVAAKEIRESIEGKAGQRIEPRDAVDEIRLVVVESKAPLKNKRAATEPMNSKAHEGAAETPAPRSP